MVHRHYLFLTQNTLSLPPPWPRLLNFVLPNNNFLKHREEEEKMIIKSMPWWIYIPGAGTKYPCPRSPLTSAMSMKPLKGLSPLRERRNTLTCPFLWSSPTTYNNIQHPDMSNPNSVKKKIKKRIFAKKQKKREWTRREKLIKVRSHLFNTQQRCNIRVHM